MPQYPPDYIDAIRNALPPSRVIGERIELRRKGAEFVALCPFHEERTPSFTVNDDKQFYHCFGCGSHGDIFRFIMEMDGLSFPASIEQLASIAGLGPPARKLDPEQAAAAQRERDRRRATERRGSGKMPRRPLQRRGRCESASGAANMHSMTTCAPRGSPKRRHSSPTTAGC